MTFVRFWCLLTEVLRIKLLHIKTPEVVLVYQYTTSSNALNMLNNYTKTKSHKQRK